jgi:L-iditol 2-dehydrogenase
MRRFAPRDIRDLPHCRPIYNSGEIDDMRVARLYGAGDLRVADEAPPGDPPAGHSLVRVTAVGLCGSDLHWFAEGGIGDAVLESPLVLGHEFAGVVQRGPRAGQRVAVDPAIPCLVCEQCREGRHNLCPSVKFAGHSDTDGGLRELMVWPDARLHPLPESISDAGGAVLEPLGVAIHAFDLAHVRIGARVAVVGCGPIGLLLVQLARAAGATSVLAIDPLDHRRAKAVEYGATTTADGEYDVAFEVAGKDESVDHAMRLVRPGAKVMLVGIPDDDRTSFSAALARRKAISLITVRRMKDVYARAIAIVERGLVDVESIVSDRFDLAEAPKAFASAVERKGLKTVVIM